MTLTREQLLVRLCDLYGTVTRILTGRGPDCLCGHLPNVGSFDSEVIDFIQESVIDALDNTIIIDEGR